MELLWKIKLIEIWGFYIGEALDCDLWVVTPCTYVGGHQNFGGPSYLSLQVTTFMTAQCQVNIHSKNLMSSRVRRFLSTTGWAKSPCAPARSVVNLYLCCVGSGKLFKKSHIHVLGGVRDLSSPPPPPHTHTHTYTHQLSTTFHYNLLPTGAQGILLTLYYIMLLCYWLLFVNSDVSLVVVLFLHF
jgi:hypothetical protein